jgi:hypothetical protein
MFLVDFVEFGQGFSPDFRVEAAFGLFEEGRAPNLGTSTTLTTKGGQSPFSVNQLIHGMFH